MTTTSGTKTVLFSLLAACAAGFLAVWIRSLASAGRLGRFRAADVLVGFVTSFFDTLGVGAFAPTASAFKIGGMVPDEFIPGTMHVGFTIPTVMQAFIFMARIEVDPATLGTSIASSVAGAWLGAGVVARWPRHNIQRAMGAALLAATIFMVAQRLGLLPRGHGALGLDGAGLALAAAGSFVLGMLLTIGIGNYAPSLMLFGSLGMSDKAIFPIMMGSCAFLMTGSSVRFVRAGRYALRPALALTVAGIPAVLLAAYVVRDLPLDVLRWVVLFIVAYTGVTLIRDSLRPVLTGRSVGD